MTACINKKLLGKCSIVLISALFSLTLAAQQNVDTYFLIDRSDTNSVNNIPEQQAFNILQEIPRSLTTSNQETGLLVLQDDTTLTLAPGSELSVNAIDRSSVGEVRKLDAELQTGSVRFDLASDNSLVTLIAGEKLITLSQGSGVVRLNEDGAVVVGLVYGGPLRVRYGELLSTETVLTSGQYVEVPADAVDAVQPSEISTSQIEAEYESFRDVIVLAAATTTTTTADDDLDQETIDDERVDEAVNDSGDAGGNTPDNTTDNTTDTTTDTTPDTTH